VGKTCLLRTSFKGFLCVTLHGVVFSFSVFAKLAFLHLAEAQWPAHQFAPLELTDRRAAVPERL
jgi:hypothetical protein